jgi:hypothetical protein
LFLAGRFSLFPAPKARLSRSRLRDVIFLT